MTAPWITAAFVIPAVMLNAFPAAHYLAPWTAVFYILLMQSLRHIRCAFPRRLGLPIAALVPVVAGAMFSIRLAAEPFGPQWNKTESGVAWCDCSPGNTERAAVKRQLTALPGKHLAIVHYDDTHNFYIDWVYNEADIDAAPVVWAHDLGPERNPDLLRYYQDRSVWLIEVDRNPPRVSPYPR